MFVRSVAIALLTLLSINTLASNSIEVQIAKEQRFNEFQRSIIEKDHSVRKSLATSSLQTEYLNALEALLTNTDVAEKYKAIAIETLQSLNLDSFSNNADKLRLARLKKEFLSLEIPYQLSLVLSELKERRELNEYFKIYSENQKTHEYIKSTDPILYNAISQTIPEYQQLSAGEIKELFDSLKTPQVGPIQSPDQQQKPIEKRSQLFMFCRHKRNNTCLFLMKDINGKLVMSEDGKTPWNQPSLGYAYSGKSFHESGGYTPSGVYEINGVMPAADSPKTFGKFRRLILDFLPKSTGEMHIVNLLPPSHHSKTWWHEAVVARDVGRDLLRIHGTGRTTYVPFSKYKPFIPTHGCVAQRENKYKNVEYIDQRLLLDQLMKAQGLEPKFENEPLIRSTLVLVEIDNKKDPVKLQDLQKLKLLN